MLARVAVGALIGNAAGRLLLVKRRRAPEVGHWGLPGGKVDFGETLVEAVAREILEELGVVIAVGDVVCILDQINRAEATHWVAPIYRATIVDGEPSNCEPEAHESIGWFKLDDPPSPLTLATRTALKALEGRTPPQDVSEAMAPHIVADGDRILLRRIQWDDLKTCAGFPYCLSSTEPLTDLTALERAYRAAGFWAEDTGALALVEKAGDRMLGTVQFHRSSATIHGYEIGYQLYDPADRGRGLASAGLRLMTALLFRERPNCQRLQLVIATGNEPSWRLAEACGFLREGLLRKSGCKPDPEDCYLYSRLRPEV